MPVQHKHKQVLLRDSGLTWSRLERQITALLMTLFKSKMTIRLAGQWRLLVVSPSLLAAANSFRSTDGSEDLASPLSFLHQPLPQSFKCN